MFNSLGTRSALLTGSVAAAAVVIAGVVSMPLIRDAAEMQAQASLSQQADLVKNVASNPHDFDAGMKHQGDLNGDLDNDLDDDNLTAPQPTQSPNALNNNAQN